MPPTDAKVLQPCVLCDIPFGCLTLDRCGVARHLRSVVAAIRDRRVEYAAGVLENLVDAIERAAATPAPCHIERVSEFTPAIGGFWWKCAAHQERFHAGAKPTWCPSPKAVIPRSSAREQSPAP